MITPQFSCSQTSTSVVVSVYCPSVRASEMEMHVETHQLTVHINPYFLRLHFSAELLTEDDAQLDDSVSSVAYDPSAGYMTITLTKAHNGEEFKDLDLLAKLLAPSSSTTVQPGIEVLASNSTEEAEPIPEGPDRETEQLTQLTDSLSLDLEKLQIMEAAINDWQLPQSVPRLHTSVTKPYGFLDLHSGYLQHVGHTENEINELGPDAETCPLIERRRSRIAREDSKFDEQHYMADFADDEYIQELLHWIHPHIQSDADVEWTDSEKKAMLRLPRREYLATPSQTHALYLTLVTLLFAYAYDARITQHEPTSESAWTICVLTPSFTALDPPPYSESSSTIGTDPPLGFDPSIVCTTLVPSYRRCLAFPLHRSFALADACRSDTAQFLRLGKRIVSRCLFELKYILERHDVYYVYSKIWVEDFCVWAQSQASDGALAQLADAVEEANVPKDSIGWGLESLERTALAVLDRSDDSDDESD